MDLAAALLAIQVGQLTSNLYRAGLASIIVGLILAGTSIWLAYETKSLLIGESANSPVREGIREIVKNAQHVEHVNEVATMHMGPNFVLPQSVLIFRMRLMHRL